MRKSKQERKDEVFKAIGQIASQKGFNNVTTKAVADVLGVTQPAIYKYFENRDELILYFMDKIDGYLLNIIETARKEKDIQKRILSLLSEHLKMVEDNEVLPIMVFSDEIYIGDIAKKEKLQTIVFNYRQNIVDLLNECPQSEIIADIMLGSIIFNGLKWRLNNKSYSLTSKVADLAQLINKLCF
ncbi:Transcriptional regulator, TetR family [Desulfurella amilsii]|uniref:Transcriptional regulator, TetR family n=1 Tax=Desulfurella amilsii TaxID=1562698 RepID=A0A1X4XXD6_9BACT|nr:TetR/AcrR family transcriptional regulator [Desulfurella amilsii]OSS42184.1 Transcriptional regulator, TetR family [Desulfurella amilsii]